ncbi:MAG: DUF6290 family protein [Furfurilactobacillus sp.]|jgi:uncharacterized protein (DUF1778 family)|uniref:type II toxin-antitoxin system RelB family antitoxin n=1 Tax=Furfurilactobacillus TaxID=2767882 RepID=UPI001F413295|nr:MULTISPECIES: DUF6290 family protein [Furfurilactobacillus]MCF6418533.1 DUF6290 family protein [Furfurilactobacillus milii]MCH4012031.1 DUF6290 family protein [Furfurilactobacillus sp.]MCH4037923.1 DUF6290 family protein [Furfurilactobacillus sp.]MCH4115440.1 DUF6290 family protein [Furfurilactobacillus sp.]MCI1341057.1 DUF6290 family protein [Furfurilactobacillus sp.]
MKNVKRNDTTITIRIAKNDKAFLEAYANSKGIGVGKFMRDLALEKVEDEHDCEAFIEAEKEFKKDSVVYTQEEVEKELGFTD